MKRSLLRFCALSLCFAGQALAGMLAHHGGGDASWRSNVAAQAILQADAMLAERAALALLEPTPATPGQPTTESAIIARIARAYIEWRDTPEGFPSEALIDALGEAADHMERKP